RAGLFALRGGSGKALNTGKAKPRTTPTTAAPRTGHAQASGVANQPQKQSPATLGFAHSGIETIVDRLQIELRVYRSGALK
ncbi:hypothetical protein, partial [Chitinibacter sp. ZOR0017]|uniref:hypothetical protein n=1 Tax=Chitinibacter sp. ZOR0017 TaxID=1339254 RepID=UPI001E4DB783